MIRLLKERRIATIRKRQEEENIKVKLSEQRVGKRLKTMKKKPEREKRNN
mgnify:CR=1 FL=1